MHTSTQVRKFMYTHVRAGRHLGGAIGAARSQKWSFLKLTPWATLFRATNHDPWELLSAATDKNTGARGL